MQNGKEIELHRQQKNRYECVHVAIKKPEDAYIQKGGYISW